MSDVALIISRNESPFVVFEIILRSVKPVPLLWSRGFKHLLIITLVKIRVEYLLKTLENIRFSEG